MSKNNYNLKFIFQVIIAFGIICMISSIILLGTNVVMTLSNVIFFAFFLAISSSSKKFFWFVIAPLVLLYAMYIPFGLMYGQITYSFLISGAATDISELAEFVQQVNMENISYSILLIMLTLF
ncbi:MAG: hypothetical protein ACRCXK_13145, partial [Wohlfahrtiimonas sp.]